MAYCYISFYSSGIFSEGKSYQVFLGNLKYWLEY